MCRTIDLDVFVTAHRREWDRLDELTRHSRSLSGAEVDELVDLYQRTATHLSAVRTSAPDPVLVARLSALVTRARGVVTGARRAGLPRGRHVLPAALPGRGVPRALVVDQRRRRRSSSSRSPSRPGWRTTRTCRRSIATPEEVRQLVDQDFASYYCSHPAGAFAAQVWTNNAWLSALAIASGALLGIPIPFLLWQNAANVGLIAGLMAAHGRLDLFFGLILPHGLLELTAVFVAAGVGLRLGWTIIAPGDRPRGAAVGVAGPGRDRGGPRPGRGAARVRCHRGVRDAVRAADVGADRHRAGRCGSAFLAYVVVLGGRAARAGETGDLDPSEVGDELPSVG